jgi:hypothetical protein
MLCPIVSLGKKEPKECEENKCAFWFEHECVIAGALRGLVRGEAPERDEPGM